MPTYSIVTIGGGTTIRRVDPDGQVWWIPENEANSDYAAYLEWLAEGNTPEPWPPAE